MRLAPVLLTLALSAVLVACGDDPAARSSGDSGDSGGSESAPPARHGVVGDAVADLSRRLDVDPADITVLSAEEVTWRDGSMGCPQPGMLYTQALTNGTRVVLEADGQRYHYHAGGRRSAFLCENPDPPAGR
jgi:hypothetical protein